LYLRLTPVEYLDFFAQVQGLRQKPGRTARIEEMLKLVGLWDLRQSMMRTFSKGMQQRVAIARTLIQDPQVLLFDEPTAALDPEAARNVRNHVRDLAAARKRTVLLCTHNLFEAEQLCHRLSIIQAGRQVAQGTSDALKARVATTCVLRVAERSALLLERLAALSGVEAVTPDGPGVITYRTRSPSQANPAVVRAAVAVGADVLSLSEAANSLEDAYLTLIAEPGA
jgi:ABC-2 type transport system ATP-binding protein